MNLKTISFNGIYKSNRNTSTKGKSIKQHATDFKDEIYLSEISSTKHNSNKRNKQSISFRTAAIGTTLALLITFFNANNTIKKPLYIKFNPTETSITAIAEENNCDLNFLLNYNNINSNTDLNSISEIIVPSSYDYLQTEIQKIQKLLTNAKLKESKKEELKKTLSAIQSKQKEQNEVAKAYTDGEYIYLVINIKENNENEKYKFGINIETLKKLFDIKDGAIKKNNELNTRLETYENGKGSYIDYTYNWFHTGDIIKVPVSAIQTKDINLSNYLED